jgi:hypothetical protein
MITVVAVNLFVIGLVVMIHYEFLYRITLLMPQLKIRHRFRIVFGVFVALTAHAAGPRAGVPVGAGTYHLVCVLPVPGNDPLLGPGLSACL